MPLCRKIINKTGYTFLLIILYPFSTFAFPGDSINLPNKSQEKSPLLLFTAGYRMPVNKNSIINSGHGLYFEGGINPTHFVTKNLVIGTYIGWAWKDNAWSTSFNSNFLKDYQPSINSDFNSSLDSMIISRSKEILSNNKGRSLTMPGCEMKSFHNYSLYYGIIIKLPYQYIPIIKLYTGTTRSHFQGGGNIITKQGDYNIIQLRRAMYGCELIIFRGMNAKPKDSSPKNSFFQKIGLSIYYEYCDFYNSSLYFDDGTHQRTIPLKRFISNSTLKKYRSEMVWGFKLSYSII